jgi:hypothetical protein
MHAKFEGEKLKIERAVSILVKWVSIMWSNLNDEYMIEFDAQNSGNGTSGVQI